MRRPGQAGWRACRCISISGDLIPAAWFSAQQRRQRRHAGPPAPNPPCGGIHLRNSCMPARNPGNALPDACCIRRRRHRRGRHTGRTSRSRTRCRGSCTQPQSGRPGRSPCRGQCSAPSFSRHLPEGRKMRRNRRLPRRRCKPRYTRKIVVGPSHPPVQVSE